MNLKFIDKDELRLLAKELAGEYTVLAPVKDRMRVSFERVSPQNQICLTFQNTTKSPKEILFPQTETLFTYQTDSNDVQIEQSPVEEGRILIMGVRPCDARSFVLLDKFFSSGEAKDPYYFQKRENTTVVGFACNQPVSTCFCTSLGGSPFGKEGMDLLLQEINDHYLIEPVTQKGEELLKKFSGLKDATKADIEKAKRLAKAAEIRVKSTVSVGDINEKLDGMFDDPLWDQVAQKCLGCGICTFLCPTCVCFDILEEEGDRQRRVRIWDSCQFSCFTLETSGHNPRPSGKERMRQRIMHKFNYFMKNYDEISCVGCGRCVQECPVNLDIREIIGEISTKEVE